MKVLDVPQYVIMRNDFVSSQVASQMAMSVLNKFGTNIAVSVVGYVDGYGSTDVAAGDVQICVAKKANDRFDFKYKKLMVRGSDRAKNIEKAIEEALILVLEHIREEGGE
jgi:nicotinamide mononucleotide (NMN) deamidase PncC